MTQALKGFDATDSGLHLEAERQKLHHLISFHQLCGNGLYVRAYEAWTELNQRYFNGSLNCPTLEIGITPYGKCAGYYSPEFNPGKIMLHQSMGLTLATLQHEMGHQWQHQIGNALYPLKGGKGGREDWHHCQSWAAFCQHTDRIDGVDRGRYVWKKQTTRSIEGVRQKAWNFFAVDGSPTQIEDGDQIGTTGFHSQHLLGQNLDGSVMTAEELAAFMELEA